MGEAILYNRRTVPDIKYDWIAAFNDPEFVEYINVDAVHNIPNNYYKNKTFSSTTIYFPSVNGYIGAHAFENCEGVQTIYFNSSYRSKAMPPDIREYAFKNCISLRTVYLSIPRNIKEYAFASLSYLYQVSVYSTSSMYPYLPTVESHAFENCSGLNNVYFSHIDKIKEYAFYGCSNMQYCNTGYSYCKGIGSHAFDGCGKLGYAYFNMSGYYYSPDDMLDDIVIDSYAFNNCSSLNYFAFYYANHIKPYAFNNCTNLANVSISKHYNTPSPYFSKKLLIIDTYAFYNCPITSTNISHIGTIHSKAFYGAPLGSGASGIGQYICLNVDDYAFEGTSATRICMNSSGYSTAILQGMDFSLLRCNIGRHAFDNLSNLECLNITNISKIYESQFMSFSKLQSLSLGLMPYSYASVSMYYEYGLVDIEPYAFKDCINLSSIDVSMIKKIGSHAFEGCSKIGTAYYSYIGNSLCFEIEDYAFSGCSAISSMYFNYTYFSAINNPSMSNFYESRLKLSSKAFYDMPNLSILSLNGCDDIPSHMFESMSNITNIDIAPLDYRYGDTYGYSARINIGEYAFKDCINLQNCYSCSYVKNIGSHAFENCVNLRNCYTGISLCEYVGEYAFANTSISYLYLNEYWSSCSNGSLVHLTIESHAFDTIRTNMIWLSNVKNISDYAFNNITFSQFTIYIYGISAEWSEYSLNITSTMFSNCPLLSTINLGYINEICEEAFLSYPFLSNVYASSINKIGSSAFKNCSVLSNLNISFVREIESTAFIGCSNLNYISPMVYISEIKERTFFNCPLSGYGYGTDISIPTCLIIQSAAFFHTGVTRLYAYAVSYIGESAFMNCYSLNRIEAPVIKYIGNSAFFNCNIEYITPMLAYVEYIGDYAFAFNSNLSSINFASSCLSYIGSYAFLGCSSLSLINMYNCNIVPNLASINAFNDLPSDYIIKTNPGWYSSFINDSVWGLLSDHIISS